MWCEFILFLFLCTSISLCTRLLRTWFQSFGITHCFHLYPYILMAAFYFWCFLIFFPIFPPLPHPSSSRGAGWFGPSLIFFPLGIELSQYSPLPHKDCCVYFLMLNFRLREGGVGKIMHAREWCSFCYDFIWNSIYFQPMCLEMPTQPVTLCPELV